MAMDTIDHIIADNRADSQTREIINAVGNANIWRDRYINLFKRYNALREQQTHEVMEADAEFDFLTEKLREHAPNTEQFRNEINSELNKVRAEAKEKADAAYKEYLEKDYRPTMEAFNIPID